MILSLLNQVCLPLVHRHEQVPNNETSETTLERTKLRGVLDIGLFQHQHMDDRKLKYRCGNVMVAVLAHCVDRIHHCCILRLSDRTNRRQVPHCISRGVPFEFRNLGQSLAGVEQSCDGMYLVSCILSEWQTLYRCFTRWLSHRSFGRTTNNNIANLPIGMESKVG